MNRFGSLYLAAAAYNGGPGRVARGLARYADDMQGARGDEAFFVLAGTHFLKSETRDYVPQLIAAALVGKEPARYGMTLALREPFAYDSVNVPAGTPLAAVARAARVETAVILDLNPHLLRGMTPPRAPWLVRVPVGSAVAFDSLFAGLGKVDRVATRVVESRKGDTIEQLARAQGIPAAAARAFNPRLRTLKRGRLVPGQMVTLPSPAVAAAALSVPDPSIEKYPRSARGLKVHAVRRGETLGAIARRYATTPERIMRLNGLKKPMIFPGQSLMISTRGAGASSATSRAAGRVKPAKAKKRPSGR